MQNMCCYGIPTYQYVLLWRTYLSICDVMAYLPINMCCYGVPTYQYVLLWHTYLSICATMAYLPINKVEAVWITIMKMFQRIRNYLVEQRMKNQNVLIEMWNINKYRHRTIHADEVWNSKLNSIIGKQQPDVFLLVQRFQGKQSLCLGN
jgi:hypothetical protein